MEESNFHSLSLFLIALFLAILNIVITVKDFFSIFNRPVYLLPNVVIHLYKTWTKSDNSKQQPVSICSGSGCCGREKREDSRLSLEEMREIIIHRMSRCEDGWEGDQGLFEEEMGVEEVKNAFMVFDENGDGFIDAGELKRVLCCLGLSEYSERECSKMIMAFDQNDDGRIEFNEFVNIFEGAT